MIDTDWDDYGAPHFPMNGLGEDSGSWWNAVFGPSPSYRPSNDLFNTVQYGEEGMGPTWSDFGQYRYMGRPQRQDPPFPDTGVRGLGAFATQQALTATQMREDLDGVMGDTKVLNVAMISLQAIAAFAAGDFHCAGQGVEQKKAEEIRMAERKDIVGMWVCFHMKSPGGGFPVPEECNALGLITAKISDCAYLCQGKNCLSVLPVVAGFGKLCVFDQQEDMLKYVASAKAKAKNQKPQPPDSDEE